MFVIFSASTLLVLLGLSSNIKQSTACNGYTLKVNKVRNCIDNSVLKLEKPGATLDKDCNLILQGCLSITKGFKTAKGKYTLKKPPMPPMEGDLDFCEVASDFNDPQMESVASMFNAPTKCPVAASKTCGGADKKINISKYKNQLGIAAGNIEVKLEVDHDTGKSCIEGSFTVSRNRARG